MKPEKRCVNCQKTFSAREYFPFCSERCKLSDLQGWLREEFRIPGSSQDDPAEGNPHDLDAADHPDQGPQRN